MFFFFFIVVAIIVAVSIWNSRRNRMTSTFTNAASRLGLRVSNDGTVMQRPWIYGEKNGVRIDVRPFTRAKGGARSVWTGYRLRFNEPVDLKISGNDDSRRRVITRLANRFSESEIEADGLFCARSALAEDSSRIIADVEYLLSAARELRQPKPPALPERVEPPMMPTAKDSTEEKPEAEADAMDEWDLDAPTFLRQKEAVAVPVTGVEEERAIPEKIETPDPPTAKTPDQAIVTETEAAAAIKTAPSPLGDAARDIFDSGLNRFEAGRRFDAEYHELSLEGTGTLRRVDRYANDRVFGRGPGFMAEVEIRKLENPSGGLQVITAVIQLPDEDESGMSIRHWRERLGEPVLACGTLIRCDAFAGKLFLRDGLVDAATVAA